MVTGAKENISYEFLSNSDVVGSGGCPMKLVEVNISGQDY